MGVLDGKVALVTGAGQGIGRGIARRFALEGAAVVLAELNQETGQRVAKEIETIGGRAIFVRTDVSKKPDVQAAVEAATRNFGRLDILVNNAIKVPTPVVMEKKTDAMLEQQLGISVWGTWWARRQDHKLHVAGHRDRCLAALRLLGGQGRNSVHDQERGHGLGAVWHFGQCSGARGRDFRFRADVRGTSRVSRVC